MTIIARAERVDEVLEVIERHYDEAYNKEEKLSVSVRSDDIGVATVNIDPPAKHRDSSELADLEITFHESVLTNKFEFLSSGGNWTPIDELSPELRTISNILKDAWNIIGFNFKSIKSGSLSTDYEDGLADREFTYETTVRHRTIIESMRR